MLEDHEKVALLEFIEENWAAFVAKVGEEAAEEIANKLQV